MKTKILSICSFFFLLNATAQENVLQESGNVGIGTTSPNAKLDVKGKVNIDSTLVVKDSVTIEKSIAVEGNANFRNVLVGGDLQVNGNATFADQLQFEGLTTIPASEDNEILTIDSLGYVQRSTIASFSTSIYQDKGEGACSGGSIANPVWSNGLNKIFSKCGFVNVGIGTDTPTHLLQVLGNTRFNQSRIEYNMGIGADPYQFTTLHIKNENRQAGIHINQAGNTRADQELLSLQYDEPTTKVIKVYNTTAGSTAMLFEANGRLTINNGTTDIFHLDPSGTLTIRSNQRKLLQLENDGKLRARYIKVDVDNWADFVFEDTYELMPLTEVEAFVKENKHLPGIQSEQELKENGMDVQEMNMQLMQKIEELTLYLIQQHKELESLKQRLEEVETKK